MSIIPDTANLRQVEKAFKTNPDPQTAAYYNGEKYFSPNSLLQNLHWMYSLESTLSLLYRYYPYQKMIKETYENYEKEQSYNLKLSGVMTLLGWAGGYSFRNMEEY